MKVINVGFLRKELETLKMVSGPIMSAAFNNTAYFHSTAQIQDSLTLYNSSSSLFTLKAMAIVSLLVPFVVAYIAYCWKSLGNSVRKY